MLDRLSVFPVSTTRVRQDFGEVRILQCAPRLEHYTDGDGQTDRESYRHKLHPHPIRRYE